ncbi:TPR repeat protein [Penicillium longicatenatum]|nr:TPR repeat protein [Penicillium longicatenatum]
MARRLSRDEYTVGWVCALSDEFTAAQEMLDEEHQDIPPNSNDSNIYTLGSIGTHNVVLACLPAGQMGTNSAVAVAIQMKTTFPAIRFGLMVGIGGGVPSKGADVRLGDIVVSQPVNGHGGVVQYDFGKSTPNGFKRTGFLNAPPPILLAAITKLRSNLDRGRSSLVPHLSRLSHLSKFNRDQAGIDVLFEAEYNHVGEHSCASCAAARRTRRNERANNAPMIHYGTIASGNQVMRDGIERDKISSEFGGILCFEMEAAGLMNDFPCLVIRGICDYADSHKNKTWQPYAAGTAAAYTRELLGVIPAADATNTKRVDEALREPMRSFYLPLLRNRQFIGRNTELNTLEQKLLVNKDCQKVALSGLGGIGKTQIALQFAYYVREKYPEFSIFWVQSLSVETFEQGCLEIARALRINQEQQSKEDVKILVRQWLCGKTAGKWLLIIDNADDLELLLGNHQTDGLLAFLPDSDDGLTIFTTRHGSVAQHLAGSDVVEIGKMAKEETIDLLEKSLVRKSPHSPETVMSLLTELEYLPLAITQAAAYINVNKSSISEYLRLFKNTEHDALAIMSTDFGDKTRYQNLGNAIAKTWTITFNKILEQDTLAADTLAFISCIEWRAIPYSILPPADPEARLVGAIGTLCSYSFLQRRDDGTKLDMHRLVHLATRMWVNQSGHEVETRMAALTHLSEVFPSDDYTNRETWRDYLPHVALLEKDEQYRDTEEMSELRLKVGRCLYVDGRMKEAVLWARESCEWRDTNLAQDDGDRLLSQHVLAMAYHANGQVKEAVKLLEHIVKIEAEVLAEDHPSRLASEHALAGAYHTNYQVKEAVKLLEHIVNIQAEALAEDHPSRLASEHELARAYHANGQVKEAVKLLEHIVKIEAEVLAEDHPSRLASEHALAGAYHANRQVKEAVKLLENIVNIQAEALAEDHPSRLASEHALAGAYHTNGQVKEAVKLLERVIKIRAEVLAEDHPDRLTSEHELAGAYHANGQVKEAVKLLEHIVKIEAEVLAEDHPDRLASEHELAGAYHANGQVKEAVKLLEHIIEIKAEVLAEDHPSRLASEHALAGAYHTNGQVKQAVKLLERVVNIQAEALAEDHPDRTLSEMLLADFYEDLSKVSETEQAYVYSDEDPVADGEEQSHFEQEIKTSQVISNNGNAFTATINQSSSDQESKPSGKSTRRFLVTRLRDILKKVK